jgi:hypothetical protein
MRASSGRLAGAPKLAADPCAPVSADFSSLFWELSTHGGLCDVSGGVLLAGSAEWALLSFTRLLVSYEDSILEDHSSTYMNPVDSISELA